MSTAPRPTLVPWSWLSLVLASHISSHIPATMQLRMACALPSLFPSTFDPLLPICVSSSSPFTLRFLTPSTLCALRSFHLRVSLAGRSVSKAFIYINFAGFLLFGGFGAPLKRRKYKIIMIIMSHFARNNMVGAEIRRGSRAIRRTNNVRRRGSPRRAQTHVDFFVRSPLPFLLFRSSSPLSFSV